mmetsp:Transcript_79681/g.202984  ORF Transcript_79681/g.202984 Transcript_79681/m.202984 type:complete len:105 (+) Transcript_79681:557-871(+)
MGDTDASHVPFSTPRVAKMDRRAASAIFASPVSARTAGRRRWRDAMRHARQERQSPQHVDEGAFVLRGEGPSLQSALRLGACTEPPARIIQEDGESFACLSFSR